MQPVTVSTILSSQQKNTDLLYDCSLISTWQLFASIRPTKRRRIQERSERYLETIIVYLTSSFPVFRNQLTHTFVYTSRKRMDALTIRKIYWKQHGVYCFLFFGLPRPINAFLRTNPQFLNLLYTDNLNIYQFPLFCDTLMSRCGAVKTVRQTLIYMQQTQQNAYNSELAVTETWRKSLLSVYTPSALCREEVTRKERAGREGRERESVGLKDVQRR